MSSVPVIVSASFEYCSDEALAWLPGRRRKVVVHLDDGDVVALASFYTDEESYVEADFLGLTERQARSLMHTRDVAYLRS